MSDWPDGIDMEALLAPIEGDAPAGVDLREDFSPQSLYYRLRDARAEARAAERSADANPTEDAVMPPQWRTVRDLSISALSGKTKDLEIAAWLTESLVRSDGLRGLAAGAHLIAGLASALWDDNLFPMPDEDGIATRVAPVSGLNGEGGGGTLIQPLRKLPLFPRADGGTLFFWQYEQSEELKKITDAARVKQRLAAGTLPLEQVETEARAAGQAHFAAQRRFAKAAAREWQAMGEVLDAKAGADGPPTSNVRELIEALLAVMQRYAPPDTDDDVAAEPEAEAAGEAAEPGAAAVAGGMVMRSAQAVVTREDMLKELAKIGEFFRKTEPQSPIAYTLEEAIRRGRMSWPDLLAELVSDTKVRDSILIQLGIRPGVEPPA
ncbi:MAG: type VI secretion protein ImpA [Rhodospirillales bacterium 70-18]|nr:type VI secretion system protein TssA [Rhodospirillales bacterium]OJY64248.1 MAG: type VI secretion protein ImpA [Rhodospirillales bacterium 70-18]